MPPGPLGIELYKHPALHPALDVRVPLWGYPEEQWSRSLQLRARLLPAKPKKGSPQLLERSSNGRAGAVKPAGQAGLDDVAAAFSI